MEFNSVYSLGQNIGIMYRDEQTDGLIQAVIFQESGEYYDVMLINYDKKVLAEVPVDQIIPLGEVPVPNDKV